MASLRFAPHGITIADAAATKLARRADRVQHRIRAAVADQIRVRSRRAEPGIVSGNDRIASREHLVQPRDASEQRFAL